MTLPRKLCAIKLRVSAINAFQQSLKCDNEEIDCDVAKLDQKTKFILHVIFRSSIIFLSQFCSLYAKRSMLCAVFPNVPVVIAMTATAYKLDRRHIKESLGMQNCFALVANSDRRIPFTKRHSYIGKILIPWRTFAGLQCMQNTMFTDVFSVV